MALNTNISYHPKFLFKNNHFNTIYRTLFQNLEINYTRKRLELEDGDFIDLDFSTVNAKKNSDYYSWSRGQF